LFCAVIRPGGKPCRPRNGNFQDAWVPIVFLMGIMLIAGAMGEQTTVFRPGFLKISFRSLTV
jgi:hypothetical protein